MANLLVKKLNKSFNIDRSRPIVFGYIRECGDVLFGDHQKENAYYDIPDVICDITLIFYHLNDKFDPDNIGKHHIFDAEENSIKHDKTIDDNIDIFWVSSFGKEIVSKGRFEWRFELKNIPNDDPWAIYIGIWKVNDEQNKKPPTGSYFTQDRGGYAYEVNCGRMVSDNGDGEGDSYGVKCVTGDILDMIIDLDKCTLSYCVNGTDLGIAKAEIESVAYRAAVMTCEDNYQVQML